MARQGSSLVHNSPMGIVSSTARQRCPTLRRVFEAFEHQGLCRLRPNCEPQPALHCNFQSATGNLEFSKLWKSTLSNSWTEANRSLKCDFIFENTKIQYRHSENFESRYIKRSVTLDQWQKTDPHFNLNKHNHHILLERKVIRKSISRP